LSFAAGWVAEIGDGTEAANDALAMGLLGEISAEGSDAVQHAVAFVEPLGKTARYPCGHQNRASRSRALAPSARYFAHATRRARTYRSMGSASKIFRTLAASVNTPRRPLSLS
jgi:hypothetical protein